MNAPNLSDLPVWFNSPVVANALTGFVTLVAIPVGIYLTAYRASVGRNHSRRLAIIDLAKKRLEFRDQALKLELAAAKGDTEEREAKQRAQVAVQKIVSDADLLTKQLEWSAQIARVLTKKPHNLQPVSLKRMQQVHYWALKVSSWMLALFGIFFLMMALTIPSLWPTGAAGHEYVWLVLSLSTVIGIFLFLGYTFTGYQAEQLKYPKPEGPILDEM